jgi:hypothetical protein
MKSHTLPQNKDSPALKELRKRKPPSYLAETTFVTLALFFFKFYSLDAFSAISFVTVLIPFMIYHILTMCGAVLEFVASLYTDNDYEETSLLNTAQVSSLVSVLQSLFAYFALYTLSGELDSLIDLKKATK